ncbi:MAG: hypothetical protein ACQKBU_04030 [Verrucomicrobiales bacterium]
MPGRNGYLPVRIEVVNQRKSDGKIRLQTVSDSGNYSDSSEVSSDFELLVSANTTSVHDHLVPVATDLSSQGTSVRVHMSGQLGLESGSLSSSFSPDMAAVLMSEALFTPNSSILDAELNRSSSSYGSASFAARFEPTRMPEDWRAYAGYDDLLLTDQDWTAMAPGVRHAVGQWCRLGGRVVIYRLQQTSSFQSLGIEGVARGSTLDYGFGSFELVKVAPDLKLNPKQTIKRHPSKRKIHDSLVNDYSTNWPVHQRFGEKTFSYALFIVVLVVFGILVGPINLFVFAKSGQRHKLFITTPIISLATSVILIGLILAKDGIGGRGMRAVLMEVVPGQKENRAYIIQEQVSRTGVLIGASFSLSEDCVLTPVPIMKSPWSRLHRGSTGGGLRYTANFEGGELAVGGDWFQSRSEQGQLIKAVVPTRGRVEIRSQTGPPVMISTFEFPLDSLYYKDHSGGFWRAKALQAGSSVTAEPISKSVYDMARQAEASTLAATQQSFLLEATERSGHFFATSAKGTAVESFGSIEWLETHTILTGPAVQ